MLELFVGAWKSVGGGLRLVLDEGEGVVGEMLAMLAGR